ncbi:MAG TPA: hypothetical protein VFD91_07960, partial [Mariniphaga sp.]|nr:hypothetical protein [Mariniphaga sp.]
MKHYISILLLHIVFLSFNLSAQLQVSSLKSEYLVNPIGIDETSPRFTWQLESANDRGMQKAYRIVVGTDEASVKSGEGNVWDSGTVESEVIPAMYKGPALEPFTRYYWSVQVKDEKGGWSEWSPVAYFEMGMIDQKNWTGQWITDTYDYNVKH